MHFNVRKQGAALVACQFTASGLLIAAILSLRFFFAGAMVLAIWSILGVLLYYRLYHCTVATESGMLYIAKGKYLHTRVSIPTRFITGCNIIETPLARILKVCYCVVHSSGHTSIIMGADKADALRLLALAAKGV